MAFTTDPTTIVGKIRLRIADRDPSNPVFQDEDLTAFYADEGNSVLRGAASALEAIAINEALVGKVVKSLQLSTDGAKLAETLLKAAQRYRDQATELEGANGAGFDIIEQVQDSFTYDEAVFKTAQRDRV